MRCPDQKIAHTFNLENHEALGPADLITPIAISSVLLVMHCLPKRVIFPLSEKDHFIVMLVQSSLEQEVVIICVSNFNILFSFYDFNLDL